MNSNTFVWLLKRESWETRAIWIAPAITAAICVVIAISLRLKLGLVVGEIDAEGTAFMEDSAKLRAMGAISINLLASAFVLTALFTQFFYSLDALYGDRRDRSILFWKSMPISDLETVLSKYFIAAVVIPAVAILFALVAHPIVFGITTVGLGGLPGNAANEAFFSASTWLNGAGLLVWLTFASVLWYLPWIGWLMAVSAFAPRSPIMWAVLPPAAIALLEEGVLNTNYFISMVGDRVGPAGLLRNALEHVEGRGLSVKIDSDSMELPQRLLEIAAPAKFFTSPDLWIGFAVAAAFVAAAVWARRYRDENG